ncbi:RNA polymerase sigma factor [Anaerococcus degeneri]|uniref:Sigma-70 family RNA polymerase sigma factor n=1 Tax=Anaerococcus degeneri TaxID=361500 RepID=A0ABS7Z006_9FIRM|nr:sigma-70 family RNA polymerase sigma factor [Anaerococcus degeneri]MBP2014846.1 RNA polymerase sigma-70 factor (ECF subfamily) [Anaerococcus degeneri]MCA2097055.1 sigma-70 family RNA polymerase sigma factor [Anaerococcus degeneri]
MDIEKIYRIYFDDLYRFLLYLCKNKEVAQDICSEVFIKSMKSIEKIEDSKVKSYLFQVGKNTYYNYYKRNKKILLTESIEDFDLALESFEKDFLEKENLTKLDMAINNLDNPYKDVVKLRLNELSFKEIGEIYHKNQNWACVVFHRAKEKLKILLEENNE